MEGVKDVKNDEGILPRAWACASSEDEENASEGRRQYLLANRDKVNWLGAPPSWWVEEDDDDSSSLLLGNLDSCDEEEMSEEEWREAVLEMLPPETRAMNLSDDELLEMVMENMSSEELFALSGL